MAEEDSGKGDGGGTLNATIDAVTGLVKAVPVYQDAVQPAAKELGKSLQTVARAVNVALLPLKGIVWSFEKIETLFIPKVEERLKDVPPEDIITPKPNVAGPALEALRYVGEEESLSDMYANLLASAMDRKTTNNAHPAFVEIIKQITPDEAKLMAYFLTTSALPLIDIRATTLDGNGGIDVSRNLSLFDQYVDLDFPAAVPSYLNNMCRLGLLEIPVGFEFVSDDLYTPLEESAKAQNVRDYIEKLPDRKYEVQRKGLIVTNFGQLFGVVCVTGKHPPENPQ